MISSEFTPLTIRLVGRAYGDNHGQSIHSSIISDLLEMDEAYRNPLFKPIRWNQHSNLQG